jgi:hypothetical protein
MKASSYLAIGAGAAALFFGGRYLLRLNRLSNELEAVTKVSIHRVTLSGLDLRIEVTLKNPTAGNVTVKLPYVKIIHGGRTVASSQVKNVDINIPKFSEIKMEPLVLNVGFAALASSMVDIMKEAKATGFINLTVNTITTINNSIPFTKSDSFKISGGLLS